MSQVYLLKNFNNYYNRIVKKYSTINQYITAAEAYAQGGTDPNFNVHPVNFNINDGITAELTYNYSLEAGYDWEPDYVLICDDGALLTDAPKYCFFVMEARRTRKGQYKVFLRRDLVADNYNRVLNSPMFIENATISNVDDPFIFNRENMKYNQIKDESEILLKDVTDRAWLVGYIATPQAQTSAAYEWTATGKLAHDIDYTTTSISSWESANLKRGLIWKSYEWSVAAIAEGETLYNYAYEYKCSVGDPSVSTSSKGRHPDTYYWRESGTASSCRTKFLNARPSGIGDLVRAVYDDHNSSMASITEAQAETMMNKNNKIIHDTTANKYYYLTVSLDPSYGGSEYYDWDITSSNYPSLYSAINTMASAAFNATGHGSDRGYRCFNNSTCDILRYQLTEIQGPYIEIQSHIPWTRYSLTDAPYCMFAIPLGKTNYYYESTLKTNNEADINLAMAFGMVESLGSAVYDLQLLPYCPKLAMWNTSSDGFIDTRNFTEHSDYSMITATGSGAAQELGIILWCTKSSGTFNISCPLSVGNYTSVDYPTTAADNIKIENETSMYRLVSPNYNGVYEFNVAKNRGVSYINIDYQYKPYNPYIHATINFQNLYGADTDDARGLVCAGDFAMPQTSDQWKQFEINNKNYEKTFIRQIENMDTLHEYDKTEARWKVGLGAVQGAASGAASGVSLGGGVGAAVGGAVGAGASIAGGIKDLELMEGRFNEQRSFAIDSFNMNMQNVQARPDILTKVSSYNPNNKIFPFIEHYHATDEEVEALKAKLKYNGMTIGKIGKIEDYIQSDYTFIRGKLIRMEEATQDFHNTAELANELEKGVFIK